MPSDFILGTILLGVTFEVPIKPRGGRLYGARATPAACAPHRAPHRLVDRKEIRPVHLFRGHAETPCAAGDVFRADRVRDAGVLAIAVVFEHENCRRLQHDSQVHRLEHRSLVTAAVAAESDADVPFSPELACNRGPNCQRWTTADDRIRTEHTLGDIGDVHRAALALAQAVPPAVNLFHHAEHVAPLGDAMAVTAVCARDVVGI